MIRTAKWIERRFPSDLPVWMFPNVLERLRGTPARVEDRVRSLPREILTVRPEQGWSIQEHVGHLWRVEELFHGRLDDYDAGLAELRPAYVPDGRATPDYNNMPISEVLSGFRTARMKLIARLEVMDEAAALRTSKHPRLGQSMSVLDTMFFFAEHDDHHLAKMTELVLTTP